MKIKAIVMPNSYRDSVFLMKLSGQAKEEGGADTVSAMMGTPRNKELFAASGLMTPEIQAANPNDLVIAVRAGEDKLDATINAVTRMLDEAPSRKREESGGVAVPATIDGALAADGDLNIALISVAGDYARYEAARAVTNGMDVMLYSDNISIADELALKTMASRKKLLVMGPDCGTAIIDGTPLAFANSVRPGPVGIVAASGTGLQEAFCLLDRMGVGISQAYGTGGRDLKDDIGGLSTLTALERLGEDRNTTTIAILGKPPGDKTRTKILARCRTLGKKVFMHYMGASDYEAENQAGIGTAGNLTDFSLMVAKHINAKAQLDGKTSDHPLPDNLKAGWLCGLFGGGTLCQEAAEIAAVRLPGEKYSNLKVKGFHPIAGKDKATGHVFLDLGDDEFTVGRPHPMMAPGLKMERLTDALCNPRVTVALIDMVIGYGAHPDQANLVVQAIEKADKQSNGASRNTVVVASVTGTEGDVPGRSDQAAILEKAGVVVLASNAHAADWAIRAAQGK
ncbi:MAG: acyl-CoA synthetase FdrA [Planctomycetota bacterium]|jgi:FdrA protein|nr:acyl-CoA synthetase FdrA [Planctomycetota bacterium]